MITWIGKEVEGIIDVWEIKGKLELVSIPVVFMPYSFVSYV